MPTAAYVVHRTPGRIRIRVPSQRGDTAFFTDVQERLMQCACVQQVATNPATGSVLIHYAKDTSDPILMLQLSGTGLRDMVDLQFGLPPLEPINRRLLRRLHEVDHTIRRVTHEQTDGTSLTLLFLLGSGVIQIIRGQTLGSAVPLLWYAGQAISGILPPRDY